MKRTKIITRRRKTEEEENIYEFRTALENSV